MERKSLFTLLLWLTLLALAACRVVDAAAPAVETNAEKVSVDSCAEPSSGKEQLIYAAKGICFLYPDSYDVFQGDDGSLTLYNRSLLNTEAPLATIHFDVLNGRTIQEVIPVYPSDAELAAMSFLTIELGEEMAPVFDHLPGQDTNRRVIAVHDDQVFDILIARYGPEYGEIGKQAEVLFNTITGSFQFIGIEPEAPLLAGPECPQAVVGTTLYTNSEDGFCLLLPDGYAVDDSLTSNAGGGETAVYVDSLLNSSSARLFITVDDAGGRTLDEVTSAKREEIEEVLGTPAMWSFGYMLDGVAANQFDQVPGQELSRQVVLVHDGRLITLTFIPDEAAAGDAYAEMQTLYDTVMESFSFLRQ
ncbi:MAG: hypothetical protein R3293_12475 [Candidatus Promineifilaceae bacterium]|nr:hypothetical protein [Candidatus Promineifilaceae bacterium]